VQFTGIATVGKEMHIDILRRLKDAVSTKRPKSGQPTVSFFFTTMLLHTGGFGQGFLSKEQSNNHAASTILS
jgi:hypothetical protein